MIKVPSAPPVPSCDLDTHGRDRGGRRRGDFAVSAETVRKASQAHRAAKAALTDNAQARAARSVGADSVLPDAGFASQVGGPVKTAAFFCPSVGA